MSQLAAGSIHKFLTGETVTGDDTQVATNINIAFELLRLAHNDTDSKLIQQANNTYTKTQIDQQFGVRDSAIAQLSIGQIPPAPNTPPIPVSLANGLQAYNNLQAAPLDRVSIQGRTLVNLLGRDGNCESLAPFTTSGTAPTLSTTQKKSGSNSIRFSASANTSVAYKDYSYPLDTTKQYLLGCWVYIESFANGNITLSVRDVGTTTFKYGVSTPTGIDSSKIGQWQFVYAKIPTSNTLVGSGFRLYIGNSGIGTCVVYMDDVRLYEVTASEYNALGTSLTATSTPTIDTKYPYVDDIKNINAPYVLKYGENLAPVFGTDWTALSGGTLTIIDPYNVRYAATASFEYVLRTRVPVVKNTDMFISFTGTNARIGILDESTLNISNYLTTNRTFNTGNNSFVYIDIVADNGGTVSCSNVMLNLGTTQKTFKPRNDDLVAFPNVQLASNVDGTVYDTLFQRDGKYWVEKRFRDVTLDGGLTWAFNIDATGYKTVYTVLASDFPQTGYFVSTKYNGSILTVSAGAIDGIGINYANEAAIIGVADTDSGWGESYTPSAAEIQAYFYGWHMTQDNINGVTPYSSGTKYWTPLDSFDGTRYNGLVTATVPTTFPVSASGLVGYIKNKSYTPYKLTYQLATPTFEEIQADAGMTLHEGLNQIEVGNGMIVREKANVFKTSYGGTINYSLEPETSSRFKYKTRKIMRVYKNGYIDPSWVISLTDAYGLERAYTLNYDLTAVYEVTYLVLDQYLLSAPVQAVTGETSANLKTLGDALAQNQADTAARVSATEILARQIYNVPQKTTAAMTLYVDGTSGADNNDGSAGKPFKTIQKAIDSIPKNTDHNNRIFVADGTYTENILINGYMGGGEIRLIGNSAAITNVKVSSITLLRNTCYLNVSYFQVIGDTSPSNGSIWAYACTNAVFSFNTTTNASVYGIHVARSFCQISDCTISNKTSVGILANNALVTCSNNGGTGNAIGIASWFGGVIGKSGTQPTGTVTESVTNGIITNGVVNPWGDNTTAARSRINCSSNTTQAISATTATKVLFQTVTTDNLTEFSSSRFTAKGAGTYNVTGGLYVSTGFGTTINFNVSLYKNGALHRQMRFDNGSSQTSPLLQFAGTIDLALGDYLEIYTTMGSAITLASGSFLDVVRIA